MLSGILYVESKVKKKHLSVNALLIKPPLQHRKVCYVLSAHDA